MTGRSDTALWTAAGAAAATGAKARGEWCASGVSIDSRTIEPGDLFVAISGPNFDGHDFVADALAAGAVAAVVHCPAERFADACDGERLLVVSDTLSALGALGQAARDRTGARIAAVTGSVGKTGTKELLRLALDDQGSTFASEGNLNNHWGLPLSLARIPRETTFGVFEIGMSGAGEIEPLSRMARPHVAIITTVAPVHSAFFESVAEIADAKAEVLDGVEPGGIAVLNCDNGFFNRLVDAAKTAGVDDIRTFGSGNSATARLLAVDLACDGSAITAELGGRRIDYRLGVPGRHWVTNSLAVLAAVDALGADAAAAATALAQMHGLKGRGQRHTVFVPGGSFVLIDESYNASPVSVTAAIEVLSQGRVSEGGRRIAVLGDMLELGDESERLHTALAENLAAGQIDLVFTAGQYTAALAEALPRTMRGSHMSMTQKLAPIVTAAVRPGDVVMVKGSLGSRTGLIVEALLGLGCDMDEDDTQCTVNGE